MKPSEINDLLELIGEFFPIDITQQKVKAWWDVLGHVEYLQAHTALVQCLQESEYIPRPAQVLRRLPKMNQTVKLSTEEGDFFEHVYRTQSERNATKRRVAGELPERPDPVSSE